MKNVPVFVIGISLFKKMLLYLCSLLQMLCKMYKPGRYSLYSFIDHMVFLELSMRLNVNEFSCLYKTFNRCTEINMHYLLIDIKLILKYMYHKH